MLLTFPVPITIFINTSIAVSRGALKDKDSLKTSIEAARAFNRDFIRDINTFEFFIRRDEETGLLFETITTFAAEREEVLNKIEASPEKTRKEEFEFLTGEFYRLSIEIQMAFMRLLEKGGQIKPASPVPVVEDFIRSLTLLKADFINFEQISGKLEGVKRFRELILKDVEFFLYLYPNEKQIAEEGKKGLAEFGEEIEKLENLIAARDKEGLIKEKENLADRSKELFPGLEKIGEFRKERAKSSHPLMDSFLHMADRVMEDKGDLIELENLFWPLADAFCSSLMNLCEFDGKNIVRSSVARKYYPFLEEKARILKDRISSIFQLLKVSMNKELLFREEAKFLPAGAGKFTLLFQFISLGGTHLNPDIYSVERDIISHESLAGQPLPSFNPADGGDTPSPDSVKTLWEEQKSEETLTDTLSRSVMQPTGIHSARAEVKQNISQDWKKTQPKEPQKKWDAKGFFASTGQSTESLLEAAMKRLKEGK